MAASSRSEPPVAILLAAGSSTRFGSANKLLARLRGRPLLLHAIAGARAMRPRRLILVTGHDALRVALVARRAGVSAIVHARDHRWGMSASLRRGLYALRRGERRVLLLLGDMPEILPAVAGLLAPRLRPGIALVRPTAAGRPGHPVIAWAPGPAALRRLRGERGLAAIVDPRRIRTVRVARAGVRRDVDRRDQLRSARRG